MSTQSLARFGLFLLILINHRVLADGQEISNRFSGFATFGLVTNDNADLHFRRDVTQNHGSRDGDIEWRTDSLLGLQWQTQWSYQWETTAQIILKDRLNNNVNESIEWAFVRYRPVDGLDFRVGRVGTDIFMLSDYRQVGYTLPWVRPPHDTYGILSFYHFDGADVNKRFDINDGTLNIKAFYGKSDNEFPLVADETKKYRLIFEGGGTSFSWERNEWKLRYSYADVEVQNNNANPLIDALINVSPFWPEANDWAERFTTKSKHFKYNQFSVAYDNNSWFVQSEFTRLNSDAPIISSSRHFYISAGVRVDKFTFYALSGYVHCVQAPLHISTPEALPPNIRQQLNGLAYATEQAFNGARASQHSVSIGTRWDFASKMALKLQLEEFNIDKYGDSLWIHTKAYEQSYASWKEQKAHVVSLSLDVLF